MQTNCWQEELPAAITVTDENGIIIEMNEKAAAVFQKSGGKQLIGKPIKDCHPEHTHGKIDQISRSEKANIYTIRKDGKRKLIYQSAYSRDGKFGGLVEISFEIPENIPEFNRD